ncbi:MAG: prepilin-type N-terminal cleavage/methylation domain-containing protein [Lysobacterales bacterium]|jgi:prepilin-type N-terminal cleavage/methylation domain-containing protein
MFSQKTKEYFNSLYSEKGFTLPELLISTLILVFIFSGVIITFITCMDLHQINTNSSIALEIVNDKITEIENTTYAQISTTYNGTTFINSDLTGIGVSYVDNSNPSLLEVTVTFTWQQANGRIIGEDTNLNGALNSGEDTNGNGILDSPITLTTAISNI